MKLNIKSKKGLKWVRRASFIVFFISAFLSSNEKTRILGVILVFALLIFGWRFYRCPSCGRALDSRIDIDRDPYCPHCGQRI
ncbi:hypothetical protein [Peptostreptococcus stomatis]|uniref:hypothetical protein n=1 Tax=Peptostreptococcus stomatis TaxID=341694 RepID=UPI003F9F94ED